MSKEHKFKRGDNVRQKFVGTGIPREYGKVLRYEHGGDWVVVSIHGSGRCFRCSEENIEYES